MKIEDFGLLYKDAYETYKTIMNNYAAFVFKVDSDTMNESGYNNLQRKIQSNLIDILNNIYKIVVDKEKRMGPNAYTPDTSSYNINYSTDGFSFNDPINSKLYY